MRRLSVFIILFGCAEEETSNPDALWTELISTEEQNRLEAELCHDAIQGWSETWSIIEERLLEEVNVRRAEGADCRTEGVFAPAEPLEMEASIRCSARYHSYWMSENEYFNHDSPGGDLGDDPWQRMERTGFRGDPVGENVAFGYENPGQAIAGWMSSDGHCANIMNPSANVIGIGYVQGSSYGHVWTQNFGYLAPHDWE